MKKKWKKYAFHSYDFFPFLCLLIYSIQIINKVMERNERNERHFPFISFIPFHSFVYRYPLYRGLTLQKTLCVVTNIGLRHAWGDMDTYSPHNQTNKKKRKEKKKENEKTIYDIILSLSFLDNIRLRKLHADRINTSRKIKEGKKTT